MLMMMGIMMVVVRIGAWVSCLIEIVGFVFGFLVLYVGGSGGGGPHQLFLQHFANCLHPHTHPYPPPIGAPGQRLGPIGGPLRPLGPWRPLVDGRP